MRWGVRWAFGEPSRRNWTPGYWSGRFTSGSIASFCRTGGRRRVRLHRSSRTTGVAATRAAGGLRCVTPPRFDADLILRADLALFYRVWLGQHRLRRRHSMRRGVVEGPSGSGEAAPRWFMWSPMARFVREQEQSLARTSARLSRVARRANHVTDGVRPMPAGWTRPSA